jgi:S-adenosylmethionine-diacylglycerol 3-amino-3-carboxypropyl transferase
MARPASFDAFPGKPLIPPPDVSDISDRASFDFVRYANCWEDAAVLLDGLEIGPSSVCLSIVSGGDNTLALLARDPELVVGVDINPSQLAMLDIKRAAIGELEHPELLTFLGIGVPERPRSETYRLLRSSLTDVARGFWDRHPEAIERGIIHAGKFEEYFAHFRRWVLPLVHRRSTTARLLEPKTQAERERFYRERWDTWRWRAIFRAFFSELVMGRMGRDPEFFRYVEGSVSERILRRVRHALTTLPGEENPFMRYILTGSFAGALPVYLEAGNAATIRRNLDRLRVVNGTIDDADRRLGVRYDACNLSDIFEYMNDDVFMAVTSHLLGVCRDGARLAYWNMLVPRSIAAAHKGRVDADTVAARRLHDCDRAFFYQAFHLDRVRAA